MLADSKLVFGTMPSAGEHCKIAPPFQLREQALDHSVTLDEFREKVACYHLWLELAHCRRQGHDEGF